MEEDYVSESFGLYEDQELIDALGGTYSRTVSRAPCQRRGGAAGKRVDLEELIR